MKLFGKKPKARPYARRTTEQRLKEKKAKMDERLLDRYDKYLDSHPSYADEIARKRFGLPEEEKGEEETFGMGGWSAGSPEEYMESMDKLMSWQEQMSQKYGKGNKNVLQMVLEALPSLPDALREVRGLIGEGKGAPQLAPTQPRAQIAETSEQDEGQRIVLQICEEIIALEPQQAAQVIYENRDNTNSPCPLLWQQLRTSSVDELKLSLEALIQEPRLSYLEPIVKELLHPKRSLWIAALFDEVNSIQIEGEVEGEVV